MPTWSTATPTSAKHMGFDLVRTPIDQPLRAIITAADFVGCDTHFWGGRTVPCERPDCPACGQGMPYRWHAYISCILSKTHDHVIFECTQLAAKSFEAYKIAHGTLRGCLFTASRPKKASNSKVCLCTHPADLTQLVLPDPPDLIKILSVIWQLPSAGVEIVTDLADHPKMTRRHTNSRAMRQPADITPHEIHISELLKIRSHQ